MQESYQQKAMFRNIVYLKSGGQIIQESDENLADKLSGVKKWGRGTIVLSSDNTTIVPLHNIAAIDTAVL